MLPEIPKQEILKKPNPAVAVLSIAVLLLYSFQNLIPGIGNLPRPLAWIIYLAFVPAAVSLYFPRLRADIKLFLHSFGEYWSFFWPFFIKFLLIYLVVSMSISMVVQEQAVNQTVLGQMSPAFLIPSVLLYAPLVEETIFRGFLRRLIRDDYGFIAISAFFFGLIHVMIPGLPAVQYLYLIVYGLTGGFFALLYVKTNNIFVSIMGHFCFNLLVLTSMLFTVLF